MFKSLIIAFAFRTIDKYLVSKINYEPVRRYIQVSYDNLEKIASLLTDKNPQDEEQLAEMWEKDKPEIIGEGLGLAKDVVKKELPPEFAEDIIALIEAAEMEILNQSV